MNALTKDEMLDLGGRLMHAVITIDSKPEFDSFITGGSSLITVHVKGVENKAYEFSAYFYSTQPDEHDQMYKELMWHLTSEESK